ncbi:uncharacterized protein JCM10292_006141 [Rhodotorula paludigena]|uniref:uncharacterized protein n=1 Tax=Rhodotorula paludigena TaxID=86838 RepID=UPI0031803C87
MQTDRSPRPVQTRIDCIQASTSPDPTLPRLRPPEGRAVRQAQPTMDCPACPSSNPPLRLSLSTVLPQPRLQVGPAGLTNGALPDAPGAAAVRRSSSEPLSSFTGSLDQPRRALEEVRQRLDDSRRQVAAAASDAEQRSDESLSLTERAEASARESLERTVDFATRLDQLAQTLNAIAQRATALSPDLDALTSDALPSSPDSLTSASRTDSMRHTIRQLILASRRVSAAVDRHRESVASASAAAAPAPASPPVPAPAVHARMPVILPSPIARPSSTSFLAPPDPLSSPSRRFTASPLPLSPLSPAPAPVRENYAGEHAQLERIAALQRDIQYRASELRQLRLRGRELEREGRRVALDGAEAVAAGGGEGDEGEKEEDDEDDGQEGAREGGAPLARALRLPRAELFAGASETSPRRQRVAAAEHRAEGTGPKRSTTLAEARRDYGVWAFCGR